MMPNTHDDPECPACGSSRTAEVESTSVAVLARAWARQPHVAAVRDEARLVREIRADLGADRVSFARCAGCGVEFARPLRAWSAAHYPDEEYGIAWDHLRALEILSAAPPLRLLEVGCAEGHFLERAAALGHRPTGLDFTAAAVRAARSRGLDAREGDVAALRAALEPGDVFQAVAMFQIIEHLCDPHALFRDLSAISAPGALLLVGCPSPRRYTRRVPHPERVGRSDFWDWPPQHSLRRFLATHGWRVERAEHEPFTLRGAAAHVTGLRGAARTPLRRRMATLRALLDVAASRARGPLSGVRLLVTARREAA